MAKKAPVSEIIEIQAIEMASLDFHVVGTSPFIMHRFSQKAWQELLLPSIRENRASLEQKLKHDPYAEFRGAFYRNSNPRAKTAYHIPNGAFHGAIASAALDMPGAKKAQIERLTKITSVNIELYGIPKIFCSMVRNSDISRTPDVRTRPIFPRWACTVSVRYAKNALTAKAVANLFGAAGEIIGIGDWRGQKGGPFGAFRTNVSVNDKEFKSILKEGRVAQLKAYDKPLFYDEDTEEILTWFATEVRRRELEGKMRSDNVKEFRVITERGKERGNGELVSLDDKRRTRRKAA
jgi:hypothetical protein